MPLLSRWLRPPLAAVLARWVVALLALLLLLLLTTGWKRALRLVLVCPGTFLLVLPWDPPAAAAPAAAPDRLANGHSGFCFACWYALGGSCWYALGGSCWCRESRAAYGADAGCCAGSGC